jgi:hypothetical protein
MTEKGIASTTEVRYDHHYLQKPRIAIEDLPLSFFTHFLTQEL